jgi:hypothetical protein
MAPTHRCAAGHDLGARAVSRPCPTCRLQLLAVRVLEADPKLAAKRIRQALDATVTNSAVLRDLATALASLFHAGRIW